MLTHLTIEKLHALHLTGMALSTCAAVVPFNLSPTGC